MYIVLTKYNSGCPVAYGPFKDKKLAEKFVKFSLGGFETSIIPFFHTTP